MAVGSFQTATAELGHVEQAGLGFVVNSTSNSVLAHLNGSCCLRCRKRGRTLRPLRPTLPASCIKVERLGRGVTRRDQSLLLDLT